MCLQGINVFFNFLASFIIGQFFNTMLCSMQVYVRALPKHSVVFQVLRLQAPVDAVHPSHQDLNMPLACQHIPFLQECLSELH